MEQHEDLPVAARRAAERFRRERRDVLDALTAAAPRPEVPAGSAWRASGSSIVSQFDRPHEFSSCYSRTATLGYLPVWDPPVLGAIFPAAV